MEATTAAMTDEAVPALVMDANTHTIALHDAPVEPQPAETSSSAATAEDAVTAVEAAVLAVPMSDIADNVEQVASDAAPVSYSLSKRLARREKRRMIADEKREKKKLQKKLAKEGRERGPEKELDMSEEAVLRRRERAIAKRETYLMGAEEGITVVIDCGFEEDMETRERKSLSQQIMFSYGANRRSQKPVSAFITSLHGETKENLEKIAGFSEWLAFKASSRCYVELFKKESLVYLTADSPNTITQLQRDKVYIIGGIVDRNRLKGITYKKALEQGIETGKLPLDQVVTMGGATRVLTVNHVFEILIQYAEQRDWGHAALATLPSRKNVQLKQEE